MKSLPVLFSFVFFSIQIHAQNSNLQCGFSHKGFEPNSLTIIPVGTSANAYGWGYAGGQRSYLWADKTLNTIVNIHRMGGTLDPDGYSGDLGYDISTDGGLTWQNQIEIYTARNIGGIMAGAMFPQCGFFNPQGNSSPDSAFVIYFSAVHSFDSITLISCGRGKIGNINDTTVNYLTNPFYPNGILDPEAYTITRNGDIWSASIIREYTSGYAYYSGYLGIFHGTWNPSTRDFDFEQFLLPFETFKNFPPVDVKIAFAPDGLHGWIGAIGDNGTIPISTCQSYFPILWKTENGGLTWEGPITVPIAGPEGLSEIRNLFTDAELQQIYGLPLPPRDEIEFTTAYDFDLHVDFEGNPHIAVIIGMTDLDMYTIITDRYNGYPNHDMLYMVATDIFWNNDEWDVHILGRLHNFRGNFGPDIYEDNRIQIASTWDGQYMFVSWLDTDLPGVYDNSQPNIFCRGISCMDQRLTYVNGEDLPYNVTALSAGMWQAYFHSQSHYVFDNEGLYRQFTIPFAYQGMSEPQDPSSPVQFMYVSDFTISSEDFVVSVQEQEKHPGIFQVSDCFPNPCKDFTSLTINAKSDLEVSVRLMNYLGKIIRFYPMTCMTGNTVFSIDFSGVPGGIYFIEVERRKGKVVRKVVVE